jgi:hypothetical protein
MCLLQYCSCTAYCWVECDIISRTNASEMAVFAWCLTVRPRLCHHFWYHHCHWDFWDFLITFCTENTTRSLSPVFCQCTLASKVEWWDKCTIALRFLPYGSWNDICYFYGHLSLVLALPLFNFALSSFGHDNISTMPSTTLKYDDAWCGPVLTIPLYSSLFQLPHLDLQHCLCIMPAI